MTAASERKNPFPFQATSTIEDLVPELLRDAPPGVDPTAPLPWLRRVRGLAERYLNSFPGDGAGQVIMIHGTHGSGKTHAIKAVLRKVQESRTQGGRAAGDGPGVPVALYARADGPDFLTVYRALVAPLRREYLQDLCRRFLGTIVSMELERRAASTEGTGLPPSDGERATAGAVAAAIERLRTDPNEVVRAFDNYLVDEGAAHDESVKEIESASGLHQEFQRVLRYLLSADLSETAYDWLQGRPVSPEEMRKLGVSQQIDAPDCAAVALQVLCRLFTRAGQPMCLCIDQVEKLTPPDDAKTTALNTLAIRKIATGVPKQNALLLLAAEERAWQALPQDVRQRFGQAGEFAVEFLALTLNEASQVIRAYVLPDEPLKPCPEAGREAGEIGFVTTSPFSRDAVEAMLSQTGGNIRSLIQICSAVYQAVLEHCEGSGPLPPIDAGFVHEVLRAAGQQPLSENSAIGAIEALLMGRGLTVRRQFDLFGLPVDLAVLDTAGQPRLLIEVQQALFYTDEAEQALASLDLLRRNQKLERPALIVLVAVGYVSREVIAALTPAVHRMLVYRPETFASELEAVVSGLNFEAPPTAAPDAERAALEGRLADLQRMVEALAQARTAEASALDDRLTEVFRKQATERAVQRREEARLSWAEERTRIEERIQEARKRRRQEELAELERLRATAEQRRQSDLERDRRKVLDAKSALEKAIEAEVATAQTRVRQSENPIERNQLLSLYTAVFIIFGILLLNLPKGLEIALPSSAFNPAAVASMGLAFLGVGITNAFVLSVKHLRESKEAPLRLEAAKMEVLDHHGKDLQRLESELQGLDGALESVVHPRAEFWAGVNSVEELRRLAARENLDESHVRAYLEDGNPHLRFAAALKADAERDQAALVQSFLTERSTIVRRELAARLGTGSIIDDLPLEEFLGSAPEAAYIVESAIRRGRLGPYDIQQLPPALGTLALLLAPNYFNYRSFAQHVAAASWGIEGHDREANLCAEAWRKGLDRMDSPELREVPAQSIRSAIRELSPFDEGGLGTLDELVVIDKIDELYLFFRQFLYYMERDALPGGPA